MKNQGMPKFEINIIINKPTDIVYQAFIDLNNMLLWTKDLEKIEIENEPFGEVGTTMRLYYDKNGQENMLEDTLEFIEPGRRIKSRITGDGLNASVETTIEAINDATRLTLIWDGRGNNVVTRIILFIFKNKIKKETLSELNYFKELVERFGAKFK